MWKFIQRVTRRKPVTALHYSPGECAESLIDECYKQSRVDSFPKHVQAALSVQTGRCTLRLMGVLLEQDGEDSTPFTEDELRRVFARGKLTAPGDDGITYSVLRLLQEVPGNPLLQLYNLYYRVGSAPSTWMCSIILPTPKPGIDKFRPISLLASARQYHYLGEPVSIHRATQAQRTHPIVQDLLDRLNKRLAPLKWHVNHATGISIPVARTVYIAYIHSLIDYLSPTLIQLTLTSLVPLEKFQNTELNLPPIKGRICSVVTRRLPPSSLQVPTVRPYGEKAQCCRLRLGYRLL
ncbi:hypothetical protein E2C01_067774 [Portunus trituberculatus]|uniref:RNA-directed DNA polymerase from transposon X-element n=1 Tax=Portunus trituberculatus TaxID=210409 RepID=A0A5B7HUI8_PORTR|nr:hypothetical protein [Portunus trituberculatus]